MRISMLAVAVAVALLAGPQPIRAHGGEDHGAPAAAQLQPTLARGPPEPGTQLATPEPGAQFAMPKETQFLLGITMQVVDAREAAETHTAGAAAAPATV